MIVYPDFSFYGYQVISKLKRDRAGGISYLAYDNSGSKVVIKQFCFNKINSSWQGFEAHQKEISMLGQIKHSRIPRYIDSFETANGYGMIQEYKNASCLATRKSFKPEEIKQILISVLEILVAIQNRLPCIIHRNLKPENILVDEYNNAYLIDFSLAVVNSKDAINSMVAGTPGFTPPEELFNHYLSTASDLYSLGVTAIALITNTPSVAITSLMDENYRFNFKHLVMGISSDFMQWLEKMIAFDVSDRYPDAVSALKALKPINIISSSTKIPSKFNKQALMFAGMVIASFSANSFQWKENIFTGDTANRSIEITTLSPQQPVSNLSNHRCQLNADILNTPQAIGYKASCYALSGNIKQAESLIQQLPPYQRKYAARAIFDLNYPVFSSNNQKSIGTITDLVIKYGLNNYTALYYGGMSAYSLGENQKAENYLRQFLDIYQFRDRTQAEVQQTLKKIQDSKQ